jgi:AraC-like DNA-binding protein
VLSTILFVTADWPAGIPFSVSVERLARIVPAASISEAVQKLAEHAFGLIVVGKGHDDSELLPLLSSAKARNCSVLVLAEDLRIPRAPDEAGQASSHPILIDALVAGAANALWAQLCWPFKLPLPGRHVTQAIAQIRGNYHAPLTVGTIADAIHVSPSHLAHRFRLETGMTVKEYVTMVRVDMARRMLVETDAKLESIASAVGFCDAPHLSRVFVQYTHRRPGEYRRRPPEQFSTSAAQNRPLSSF